jgi:hypothetical protein
MRVIMLPIVVVLVLAAAASACLWDSDTLRYETKGMPGLVEVITGRIERQPPLYYQMRLERVAKLVQTEPGNLGAYDDAGVACDRLGRGDEAIGWMARKKEQLDRIDTAAGQGKEHLYRYHANLGTFLAHRWVRAGADRGVMADLVQGRDHIAEAIRINPDAHFGREKYQLMAMEWIIAAPPSTGSGLACMLDMDPSAPRGPSLKGSPASQRAAIEGLSGLVALGNAWESFDVFYALAVALGAQGDAYLAYLADNRCREIAAAGGRSLHPDNKPRDEEPYAKWLGDSVHYRGIVQVTDEQELDRFFTRARADADQWRAEREAFVLARLERGEHPDTHAGFWTGYEERPAPTPPGRLFRISTNQRVAVGAAVVFGVPIACVLMGWWLVRRVLRRRVAAGG